MENNACPIQTDQEQHWRKIIAAVQDSTAAEVWFQLKSDLAQAEAAKPSASAMVSGTPGRG